MYRVKIIGAGSIGNHLAHAARALSWDVTLCDIDDDALMRTRRDIYPSRYGKWDDDIQLCNVKDVSKSGYDLVFVGTPPEYHIDLAIEAIESEAQGVLIEKPLCTPSLERAQELCDLVRRRGTKVFVGYDHVVGKAADKMRSVLSAIGEVQTIDVEFREFWGGIFSAHFWLDGPWETYLGYWKRGGGATGEHSHAANLFQHFASHIGAGRVIQVSAMSKYVQDGRIDYDQLCVMNVQCESGLIGRIVQDVVTTPPRKWARVQSMSGFAEWYCGFQSGQDLVSWKTQDGDNRRGAGS